MSRILPRTASRVAIVVAFLGTVAGAAAQDLVYVQVRTVLATDRDAPFDARLANLRKQLEGLFRYSSYRLVKEERRGCRFGSSHSFEIPGGRFLQIVPKEVRGQRVRLRVMLIEGAAAPRLDTDFTLPNHGNLWVAGPRHPEGVLLISIGADAE